MSDRIRRAEILLDSIGNIDDRFVSEALTYRPARRMPRLALIAACMVLSFAVIIGSIGILQKNRFEVSTESGNMAAPEGSQNGTTQDSLDGLLATVSDKYGKVEGEKLPYRDGNSYIVWQRVGHKSFYVSQPLTASQASTLKRNMGVGREVGETSPELLYRVWVISDGEVRSPYLKNNSGNVSSGVFDYDAEIYPNDDLVNYVSAILE